MRAIGILIEGGKILLLRRVKEGRGYFVFPGGGVEEGETAEMAVKREIKEELSLDAKNIDKIFENINQGNPEVYFLIKDYTGNPKLGGPEKARMNEQNQYYLEWIELSKMKEMENLYPREAIIKLLNLNII